MEDQALAALRSQLGAIILGTVFLFLGLAAGGIAAVRHRGGVRVLLWFGIFSGMYGARMLAEVPAAFSLLPRSTWATRPLVVAVLTYLIIIPALLFWRELSLGTLRQVLLIPLFAACALGVAGVGATLTTHSPYRLMPFNNLLVIAFLLLLLMVSAVPSLAKRFLAIPSRVAGAGTLVLAAAALHSNLRAFLHLPFSSFDFEPIAFAVFVLSLGYVAAERIFADERRLLAIQKELSIAREIQSSILPRSDPAISRLRVSAAYRPMTAVAGDFYEFVPVDRNRVGFLVADVSGHGVPAALFASMIKVAMQAVASRAHEPGEVLRGLNRILSAQLRGQLVSAAYLWLDTEGRRGLYSAAGHPPLLCWRNGELRRVESNGLLFGVRPDSDYPVCDVPLKTGDRFLLYTDGATEPENAKGQAFGDHKLEEVLSDVQSRPPSEVSSRLLREIGDWQPPHTSQQDDITLIVIDCV